MDKKNWWYVGLALVLGLVVGYGVLRERPGGNGPVGQMGEGMMGGQGVSGEPSRGNCLADDCLLVEDLEYPVSELPNEVVTALDEAINDEYKALATYEAVVEEFGTVRPFSMIIGAEEQHIASLKAIYDKYGLVVPENTWASKVSVPTSLEEACQTGVEAEIANAALYKDELLPVVVDYEDITWIFTSLMEASEGKHLPAFEKCN